MKTLFLLLFINNSESACNIIDPKSIYDCNSCQTDFEKEQCSKNLVRHVVPTTEEKEDNSYKTLNNQRRIKNEAAAQATISEEQEKEQLKLINQKIQAEFNNEIEEDLFILTNRAVKCQVKEKDGFKVTLDYGDCRDAINAYNAAFISEQAVLNPGIQISQVTAQNQATQQVANNPLNPTAGLKAVGGVVENQKNNEIVKASFYGANAGLMSRMMMSWKTPKWLKKGLTDEEHESRCERILGHAECEFLSDYLNKHNEEVKLYFANGSVKGFFTQEITRYAGQSAMSGVLAGQYAKQKNLLDKTNEDLKEFADDIQELPSVESCAANPALPGCSAGTRSNHQAVGHGGFTFSGDANQTGFNAEALDESSNGPDKLSAEEQQALASGLANLSDPAARGLKDVAPGAGFYEQGGAAGGGAAAPGGGGGGGGSAQLSDTPGEAENQNKEASEIKVGSSNIAYDRGKGLAGSPSRQPAKDLFSGLSDSDKKKTGGVEVERGLASDIDAGNSVLFEKISKRYGKVIDEKRLVEVEQEK